MSQENKPEEIDYPFPIEPTAPEAPKPNYPYPAANPQPNYQPQSAYQPQPTYQPPVYTPAPPHPPAPVVTLETYSTNMSPVPNLPPVRTPSASSNTALEVTVGVITFLVILALIAALVYYIWFS